MSEAAQDPELARQCKWIGKMRVSLMCVATLAVYTTYRTGLNAARHPATSYAWVTRFNAMAMAASATILVLLSSERLYRTSTRMATLKLMVLVDLGCLVSALAFANSPGDPVSGFAYTLLAPVAICVLAYSGAYVWTRA